MDVDDDPDLDLLGAESGYYESLDPPYTAKNGPIDSLGELLLIKGVTPIVYEKLTTACDGAPCLTIAPTKTINVNTVSIQVCQSLHEDLTQEFCEDLETIRPLKNKSGKYFPGSWNIGIRTKLNNIIAVGSEYFFIRTIGEVQETQKVIEALVHRKGSNAQLLTWRIR